MDIEIWYGPTGCGKSWSAFHTEEGLRLGQYKVTWPEKGGWWWPNYNGEHLCIADEFYGQIPFRKLLSWMDPNGFMIQYKGGNKEFLSKKMIFTTNLKPTDWYRKVQDRSPLWRRMRDYCKVYKYQVPTNWDDPNYVKKQEDIVRHRMEYNSVSMLFERKWPDVPDSPSLLDDDMDVVEQDQNQQSAMHEYGIVPQFEIPDDDQGRMQEWGEDV